MISVQEAKQFVLSQAPLLPAISVSLYEALGYALSENVYAPIDFPSFPQSAMDGYAFAFSNWKAGQKMKIIGEVQAGQFIDTISKEHDGAVRIFTGAQIPEGMDTVVMQEKTNRIDNEILIEDDTLFKGQHIRSIGSQSRQGEVILKQGHQITPSSAALLASIGMFTIQVYRKPEILLIHTGKELVHAGNQLQSGQVFESNSYALKLALQELNLAVKEILFVDDDQQLTSKLVASSIKKADLLLFTGGVSVGDYDFVVKAFESNGVIQHFHKVKQKPGKPLYFGTKENTSLFGLPGNPGSVMTCFYQYVVPHIKKRMGCSNIEPTKLLLPLSNMYTKKSGLTHFLKGKISKHQVDYLDHQESYKMNAFAIADCLIEIEEEAGIIQKGDLVKVYLLKS